MHNSFDYILLFCLLRCLKILKNEFVKDLSKRYSKLFDMEVQ
jgi:hypothetical protein